MAEERSRAFSSACEEEEVLLMRRPLAAQEAYARFGLLLGTLPPAAIFLKLFGRMLVGPGDSIHPRLLFLLFLMNAFCAAAGLFFGSRLSRLASAAEELRWPIMLIAAAGIGFIWGVATGAVGGLPAFGFGAIVGAICAVPVGMLAFLLFVPLHRLLTRGGMIDARHLWPLACGVVTVITALILRM
ncbi:MAG TPA: hypothetical protein VGC87_12300 [Pyrinomonadaceae bacterium]